MGGPFSRENENAALEGRKKLKSWSSGAADLPESHGNQSGRKKGKPRKGGGDGGGGALLQRRGAPKACAQKPIGEKNPDEVTGRRKTARGRADDDGGSNGAEACGEASGDADKRLGSQERDNVAGENSAQVRRKPNA